MYGIKGTIRLRRKRGRGTKANTCISFSHMGIYFMKDTYNVIHVIITEAFCFHFLLRDTTHKIVATETKQNTKNYT